MFRIGQSSDIHQLAEGRRLVLGGVEIEHTKGLVGHSDADALLHAIAEAVIGALGEGDLGKHFPDTDPQYKGISSLLLLEQVTKLMESKGYCIGNVDALIMIERPKMAPHIPLMRQNIAQALHCAEDQVNVKATRGGYDGHGVWFPETLQECEQLVTDLLEKGVVLYAEEKVNFARELSAMVARNRDGEVKAWPVVESRQADGVCHIAIAPAPELPADVAKQCRDLATNIATKLDVTGVLAVELFECIGEDGASKILVNELAMRPHNTGHWTQDGCVTSQFEQHLRAVLNWPLGSVDTLEPVTVMVNTLGAEEDPQMPMEQRVIEVMRRYPEAKVHLYGKSWRPGRKMGHVNVTGYDATSTLAIAQHAAHFIVHANWY